MGGIFVGLFAEGLKESEFCGFEVNRTQQRLKQIILEMIILYLKDLLLDRIYRIQAINFEPVQTISYLSDELVFVSTNGSINFMALDYSNQKFVMYFDVGGKNETNKNILKFSRAVT